MASHLPVPAKGLRPRRSDVGRVGVRASGRDTTVVVSRSGSDVELRPAAGAAMTLDYDSLLDALIEEQSPAEERRRLTAARVRLVAAALGGVRAAARALDVAPSQVSRWSSGEARPGPDHARKLLELDHVIAQAQLLWATDDLVQDWLTSYNHHLGARPIDVTVLTGSAPVVEAIRAELSGGYA